MFLTFSNIPSTWKAFRGILSLNVLRFKASRTQISMMKRIWQSKMHLISGEVNRLFWIALASLGLKRLGVTQPVIHPVTLTRKRRCNNAKA
jgi:hypothetical protein